MLGFRFADKVNGFRAPPGRESLFFAHAKKSDQKKARPGRSPAGYARRCPALLASSGDGAELAALAPLDQRAPVVPTRRHAPMCCRAALSTLHAWPAPLRPRCHCDARLAPRGRGVKITSNSSCARPTVGPTTPVPGKPIAGRSDPWSDMFLLSITLPERGSALRFPCAPAMCGGLARVGWRDCRKHGCFRQAPKDGFTACPANPPAPTQSAHTSVTAFDLGC